MKPLPRWLSLFLTIGLGLSFGVALSSIFLHTGMAGYVLAGGIFGFCLIGCGIACSNAASLHLIIVHRA